MDKRFAFFVVALCGALFAANLYFQNDYDEKLKQWTAAQEAKSLAAKVDLDKEIGKNQLSVKNFPLTSVYADEEGTKALGTAFFQDGSLITLNPKLPEVLFTKDVSSKEPLKLFRKTKTSLPHGAAIYAEDGKPLELKVADLPDFGRFSLQMIVEGRKESLPAIYMDGQFKLLEKERKLLETPPSSLDISEGLLLFKVEDSWLPIGVYDPIEDKVEWLEDIHGLTTVKISSAGKSLPTAQGKTEEQFFVLENPYLQLVISSYGGALAEINLPFKGDEGSESVVKPVEIDREILEKYPSNARFPLHAYQVATDKGVEKKLEGKLGGYYPLIRRDLYLPPKNTLVRTPPKFYAMNLISEFPELAELPYRVVKFTADQLVLEAKQNHRKITKTYTLSSDPKAGPYCFDLSLLIEGDTRGLWLTTGIPEVEWISGGPAPALKYRITRHQKGEVEVIDLPKDATTVTSSVPDWLCNSNGFFGLILDPLTEVSPGFRATYVAGSQAPSRLTVIDHEYQLYPADKMPGYLLMLPLKNMTTPLNFRVFAGPFATSVLEKVDQAYADPSVGYNPDYLACQTFHGWFAFISEPFAKFLFFLMRGFYSATHSWALSIILLTIALRLMLYPLNAWSLRSTVQMQAIAPEIKALQEKYKKEPQKAQMAIINLYRERKINPLSGCLPLLIQMPFLIGMFDLLKSTFELRGASMIPGWIDDLSAPDVLFSWDYPIFFIGNEFHLLPFILGGVMFLQQRMMSTAPADPSAMTEQQRQQKAMGSVMTVVFTLMFYNFPSGLNIYWLSSMLLGIGQQWWTQKKMRGAMQGKVSP